MRSIKKAKTRTIKDQGELRIIVQEMIDRIIKEGDSALREYNERFDKCTRENLRISSEEIAEAYELVPKDEIDDIKAAARNIAAFATAQRGTLGELEDFSPAPGIWLGQRIIPVDSCCCYVPGGGYPLYSTALMLGIPAKVAGVERITACSPTMKGTNKINPKTLVAMDIAGIDEIYAVGGAQAIAALSYGTEQIKPVNLIVGPGNSFVTEAKRQCYGKVGIDFLAGPSEVLVIADKAANPEIIAADMLAQSEHDKEAKGILVTTDEALAKATIEAVERQLSELSTRNIAEKSWADYGEVILVDSIDEAIDYSNEYAPEHLEINIDEKLIDEVIPRLRNYGSLFIGENTAEVFGDYASGTNHTLPTLGAAMYTGGVWVGTFLKTNTYQRMSVDGMRSIAPLVSSLAQGEGLEGHSNAAEVRLREIKQKT
ncbi:MAG: histidinol dehydrogenase [Bacillota bacterium]|nr:histidinol dehydrogenase [Bacillota bacterium]